MDRKKIAIAVAFACAIVIPWMIFGGDLGTGSADPRWGNPWDCSTWSELDQILLGC